MSGDSLAAPDIADVGVVVAVRNAEATVGAAIDSVLDNGVPPERIVVIDGASSDRTAEVAERRGVVVTPQHELGLAAARNQGVAGLDAPLVAFCDGDDRWATESLAVRVEHLGAHAACAAVVGHYLPVSIDPAGERDGESDPDVAPRPALTPGGLLVRRDALHQVGPFPEDLSVGADSAWFVRLRQSGLRFDVIDPVVLLKGVHERQLSRDTAAYRRELLGVARNFVRRERGE